jgi:hypothetical protein
MQEAAEMRSGEHFSVRLKLRACALANTFGSASRHDFADLTEYRG